MSDTSECINVAALEPFVHCSNTFRTCSERPQSSVKPLSDSHSVDLSDKVPEVADPEKLMLLANDVNYRELIKHPVVVAFMELQMMSWRHILWRWTLCFLYLAFILIHIFHVIISYKLCPEIFPKYPVTGYLLAST